MAIFNGKNPVVAGLAVIGSLVGLTAMLILVGPHAPSSSGSQLQAGAKAIAMRDVYLSNCASCHGERGQGGDGVIDFTSAPSVAKLTRNRMTKALYKRHGGRLAEDLLEAELEGVTDFIREYLMLPAPFEDASAGRRIYSESCSVCHGERGDGASWAQSSLNPPPVDFAAADPEVLTREYMIAAVTFGKPSTAMMPFATQLTTEEIAATVDYIRIAFMNEKQSLASAAHEAKTPSRNGAANGLAPSGPHASTGGSLADIINAGDREVGEALYAANCVQCHGEEGDGQGRRAYFMVIKPADFTTVAFRMRMNRERLFHAISKGVVGSPMPAWDKALQPREIADLAAYVNDAFVAPREEGGLEWEAGSKKKD